MTSQRWSEKVRRLAMALVLLNAVALVPLTPATQARTLAGELRASEVVEEGEGSEPGGETERWWGVAGAVLCGAEIRLIIKYPAIGMNPWAIAAGIAGCSLAALDILTTK